MRITNQVLAMILAPGIEKDIEDLRLFSTIRGDGELSGDLYCSKHAEELPEYDDYVEILDIRKGDECCVCRDQRKYG